jgi:hypothetical protein
LADVNDRRWIVKQGVALLNRRHLIAAIAVLAAVAVPIYVLFSQNRVEPAQTISGVPQGWYTEDDGQTWFRADLNKLTPFDHNGKQAYRCFVWTCDGGKTQFVSHVQRYKPAVLRMYATKGTIELWEVPPGGVEVKPALSTAGWADASLPEAQPIITPRCPGARGQTPVPVDAQPPATNR